MSVYCLGQRHLVKNKETMDLKMFLIDAPAYMHKNTL
jgi:hypothetical protein